MINNNGIIFDIQRFSLNDGPGIRTTVFLKGCPLRCIWCHNPESQSFEKQFSYNEEKCVNCFKCVSSCPSRAHKIEDGLHHVDFSKCTLSEECVKVCEYSALKIIGTDASVKGILDVVRRDILYYKNSGGGLTLSGGEPMAQFGFTKELLKAAKVDGIHTCIETCGFAPENRYRDILPYTDLFLFDYKETDAEKHKEFTGVSNDLILSNLNFLRTNNATIILRCPIIPGFNDTEQHFKGIISLSKRYHDNLSVEILPYHDLGKSKAKQVGKTYLPESKTVGDELKLSWIESLKNMGVNVV